jgi:hypothetical protein
LSELAKFRIPKYVIDNIELLAGWGNKKRLRENCLDPLSPIP